MGYSLFSGGITRTTRAWKTLPRRRLTAQGIPGDPLNVGLIGTRKELISAMLDAGWDPADPTTLKSSLGIAGSVLLRRPYRDAPVSNLFVFGRRQDLAFEKPVGRSASHRHHVRFWRAPELGQDGVPLWIGAVTYDRSVGLSHRTGQITHHIAPDIDAERDGLITDLDPGQAARQALPGHRSRLDPDRPQWRRRPILHRWRADDRRPRPGPPDRMAPQPARRPDQGPVLDHDPPLAPVHHGLKV